MNSNNPELIAVYDKLVSIKKMLAQQYSLPGSKRTLNTDSLETAANDLEKQLQRNPTLTGFQALSEFTTWQDIQKNLGKDEAAIEFVSFSYRGQKKWNDSTMYCALIVRPGYNQPEMIPLFEEKQLAALIERQPDEVKDDYSYIRRLYKPESWAQSTSNRISQLIWQPTEKYLSGVKTVYYSPSGLLHKISFSAIPLNDSLLLSDKYNLVALSTTKNILNKTEKKIDVNTVSATIYGGIKYDVPLPEIKIVADNSFSPKKPSLRSLLPDSLLRGISWQYLRGTLTEANKIDSLFLQKSKSKNIRLITDTSATEESFKALSGNNSPNILHIATHGFYFPEPKEEKRNLSNIGEVQFVKSGNPLFRSGIMLAGGNRVWNEELQNSTRDDGVLTAYEISQLYFPNTHLVVLSACETGLGQVKGSEGVFGLQRALKMAQVDYIILSLWTVPDKQTQELMTLFYGNYLSGKPIIESFKTAQNDMKTKYKNEPFVWAAFVLIN
jgi:CHAT domain-containing protein